MSQDTGLIHVEIGERPTEMFAEGHIIMPEPRPTAIDVVAVRFLWLLLLLLLLLLLFTLSVSGNGRGSHRDGGHWLDEEL